MLRQRIITAIVLLAALLPALFAQSAYVFILVSLLLIAPAGWEWATFRHTAPVTSTGRSSARIRVTCPF